MEHKLVVLTKMVNGGVFKCKLLIDAFTNIYIILPVHLVRYFSKIGLKKFAIIWFNLLSDQLTKWDLTKALGVVFMYTMNSCTTVYSWNKEFLEFKSFV